MRILRDAKELAPFARGVFVPTMGALHEGHAALVRHARARADLEPRGGPVVVSVFVNPTQFNDPGDLARYPRTVEADAAICRAAGADAVWVPDPTSIYPPGETIPVPPLPAVAVEPGLEDRFRPGHFAGVCQVVRRLFELVQPREAVFGEKDWQQLRVISAMVGSLQLPVHVEPVSTIRENDGLAMSSRNRFLAPEERARATAVSRALVEAGGAADVPGAERAMRRVLDGAGAEVEYATVRDALTLMPPGPKVRAPLRALIAVRLGSIRLIDNAAWRPAFST